MTGLAFGILLLSEVFYYYSFDSFYPDANRLYVVYENFEMDKSSDKLESIPRVSGAIAPGLKAEVPGIEAATRLNSIGPSVFYTDDLKKYKAEFSLADENVFDVLPRPIIAGNPKEIFKIPMKCMVSSKIAEIMGSNVIGKIIELKNFPGKRFTISGVFQDLPENTTYKYDVLISMTSTNQLFNSDGTNNWLGNDRYFACVKLAPGVTPESLAPAVRKMQEKNQDIVKLERIQQGMVLKYSFHPIRKIHAEEMKDMIIILSIIAFSVLFVSLMNYILLTLNALANRSKISAVYRTCGAKGRHLHQLIFSETALLLLASLMGAVFLILAVKPFAEAQTGHRLSSLVNPYVITPSLLLIIVISILISYFPGRFYSKIPVTSAFRSFQQKRNRWKLVLLSFQFIGASFILTVMVIVAMQYNKMRNADHGYKVKGVYYGSTSGMNGNRIAALMDKLKSMPEFDNIGLGFCLPIDVASGNNILLPGQEKELFNVADFYWIDENYLSILGIPVTEGSYFSTNSAPDDLLISKKGAKMLALNAGWNDGVIGKQINVTEHGLATIQGTYPDFIINSISQPDSRPSIFFYMPREKMRKFIDENQSRSFYVLIKASKGSAANITKKLTNLFNQFLPHQDAVVKSLEAEQQNCYLGERGFRNAIMTGNLIILLITIIGLLGYITNEAARRSKELAIRRINGARLSNILQMFIYDLECIVIPAIIIGLSAAWLTADKWMTNFAVRISLHWGIFAACSLGIILLVACIAAISYTRIANRNPVESLRYE